MTCLYFILTTSLITLSLYRTDEIATIHRTVITPYNASEIVLRCSAAENFIQTHMAPDFESPHLVRRLDWFHDETLIASYQQTRMKSITDSRRGTSSVSAYSRSVIKTRMKSITDSRRGTSSVSAYSRSGSCYDDHHHRQCLQQLIDLHTKSSLTYPPHRSHPLLKLKLHNQ
ncbi:hypothetical protein DICVIV_05314 [Dictyocaulus viviparus]|uniref:Uncharacterized protein n=1 Tax=Dictyocaulus viviparus TaxID=29172 RepID=A0A0D8XVM8_DICVI|nr:hypothetical protein DICVIV_05314 [Dictyocaulus viviparus]